MITRILGWIVANCGGLLAAESEVKVYILSDGDAVWARRMRAGADMEPTVSQPGNGGEQPGDGGRGSSFVCSRALHPLLARVRQVVLAQPSHRDDRGE